MSEGTSIINFGELSKPATVLIEKISDAVGGIFRPAQVKRVAKAEAEAEIIRAKAKIEVTELQRRALERFITEEAIKQANMEAITEKALPSLPETSKPHEMDNDWIANFFDKCRIVSDEEMQALWGRVLAGEANAPGAFSKRTVGHLASLDKFDAVLFTNLVRFCWTFGDDAIPLIYDVEETPIYQELGIGFGTLTHLDNIGLVTFDALSGYRRVGLGKCFTTAYSKAPIIVEFANENTKNELSLGHVLLSRVGKELARVCDAQPVDGFMEYVLQQWLQRGLRPASPYPRPRA